MIDIEVYRYIEVYLRYTTKKMVNCDNGNDE